MLNSLGSRYLGPNEIGESYPRSDGKGKPYCEIYVNKVGQGLSMTSRFHGAVDEILHGERDQKKGP